MRDKRIQAYYIHRNLLPKATQLMNTESGDYGIFKSKVIDIIYQIDSDCRFNYDEVIVIVEIEGEYSYITNKWKEELKASHEFWMGDTDRWKNQGRNDYFEGGIE